MGSGIDGNGSHAKRSQAARRAMLARAERTKCHKCERKNATKRHLLDGGMMAIDKCRYCQHERTVWDNWPKAFTPEKP